MKSKAQINGHPIHPILIAFPIAFFTGTFLLDLLRLFSLSDLPGQMAYYLEIAGIVTALLAAVPGMIDYFGAVPPDSSGRRRATKHALLNVTQVLLFTMAFVLRTREGISLATLLFMEGAGMILMTIAGWMGGTLVYRNQIGVDHRYAHAGKWAEKEAKTTRGMLEVNGLEQLKVNQMQLIHADGKRIVVGRTETGFVAFEDHCTHRGGSLADGVMICDTVQCPWHGSQFDTHTGMVKAGPAKTAIKTYEIVQGEGTRLLIRLEEEKVLQPELVEHP